MTAQAPTFASFVVAAALAQVRPEDLRERLTREERVVVGGLELARRGSELVEVRPLWPGRAG